MAHESIRKYLLKNNMDADKIMSEADDEERVEGPDEAELEHEIEGRGERLRRSAGPESGALVKFMAKSGLSPKKAAALLLGSGALGGAAAGALGGGLEGGFVNRRPDEEEE